MKQLNKSLRKSISRASCSSVKQLNNFYVEVDESDFVFPGSLPSTGKIYVYQIEASLADKTSRKFNDLFYECVECASPL